MLKKTVVALVILLCVWQSYAQLNCHDRQIARLVSDVYLDETSDSVRQALLRDPKQSVCYLIRELHVVHAEVMTPYDSTNYTSTLHVITCLQLIRFLTGGKINFTAPTSHRFRSWEVNRRRFLIDDSTGESKFFRYWESRGSIFIAPVDAQRRIIRKWIGWYRKYGAEYQYTPAENQPDWYD